MTDKVKASYTQKVESREHVEFGVQDKAGREVGTFLTIRKREHTADETACWLIAKWMVDAGTVYGYDIHATRNGAEFGALNSTRWFATIDEAQSMGAKAVERSRKVYQRRFGK